MWGLADTCRYGRRYALFLALRWSDGPRRVVLRKPMADTLSLTVLGCRIAVQCKDAEARALLVANYGHMQGQWAASDWQYVVGKPRGSSAFFVMRAGQKPLLAEDDSEFLWLFEKDLTIELQKRRHDLYFVHSAVLEFAGKACMLVGPSGSGKSTITWALLHCGFRYLSDELAPVDPQTHDVYPYLHALCLKDTSSSPYPLPEKALSTARALYIPLTAVSSTVMSSSVPLAAIFFLRYCPQASEPVMRPIRKAEAGARLFAQALNPLAHPSDGLDGALAIVTRSACFTLDTAEVPATCALVTATLERFFRGQRATGESSGDNSAARRAE
jgi:hypothetical protein